MPFMNSTPEMIKDNLRTIAGLCGFDLFGISGAGEAGHAKEFISWLESGNQADMEWMARTPERRVSSALVLPGANSVVMLGMNYYPGTATVPEGAGRFARYAWGEDYHGILEEKLKDIQEYMESVGGEQRIYVDAGPVLERDRAAAAGLGWCGKSSLLIHPSLGSWTFLASIVTTLDLPRDAPISSRCGFCRRCLDSCPTGAIVDSHFVDARRCLSYWTIENKGEIPLEFRKAMGNRVYGCDSCLEACPWNRKAERTREPRFVSKKALLQRPLREYLGMTEEEFGEAFKRSPIKRIKRRGLMRNVCVALGNIGTAADIPALTEVQKGDDPLLAEHASWALAEIEKRLASS